MVVISQGPIIYYDKIEESWEIPIIHSGWQEDFHHKNAIHSDKPEDYGPQNLYLQQRTTLNGLFEAKEQGYTHAIKIRSDMIPTNSNKLLSLLGHDVDFLFYHNYMGGYLVDYFQAGPIDKLIDLWLFEKASYLFPEEALTKRAKKIKIKLNFIGKYLNKENDILWIKNNKLISSYKDDNLFLDHER